MNNHPRNKVPAIFQTLAADGAAPSEDQRSRPRQLLMAFVIALVTVGTFAWAMPAQGADDAQAVLSGKQAVAAADDDDDDANAAGGTNSDPGTGRETAGNTDRGGQNTGLSTRGETDGRDGTGATERTQGTGRETRGDSDDGRDTGRETRGDTDGNGTDSSIGGDTDSAGGDDASGDTDTD